MEFIVSAPKAKRTLTIDYNFGNDLEEASGMFTASVVFALFKRMAKIQVNDLTRRLLEVGISEKDLENNVEALTDDVILQKVENHILGIPQTRSKKVEKSLLEQVQDKINSGELSEDEAGSIMAALEEA